MLGFLFKSSVCEVYKLMKFSLILLVHSVQIYEINIHLNRPTLNRKLVHLCGLSSS